MARLRRPYLPDCPQHVIQRGNNRQACFADEGDYKTYLSHLDAAAKKYNVAVHAFVLMTNHVHLLATPSDQEGISRMMQGPMGSESLILEINGVRVVDFRVTGNYAGSRGSESLILGSLGLESLIFDND